MNAAEEPHFLVNDFLIEATEELEKVISVLNKKTPPYYEKSRFLKNFANNMFRTYHIKRKEWGIEEKNKYIEEIKEAEKEEHAIEYIIENKEKILEKRKEEKEEIKKQLLQKKEEILKKIEEMIKKEQGELGQPSARESLKSPQQSEELSRQQEVKERSEHSNDKTNNTPEIPIPKPFMPGQENNKQISIPRPNTQINQPTAHQINKPPIVPLPPMSKALVNNSKTPVESEETKSYYTPRIPTLEELQNLKSKQDLIPESIQETQEYGKITNLINNQDIEEIICDSPDQSIKVVEDKKEKIIGLKLSDQEINKIIQDLAEKTQQIVNKENPFLIAEYNNMQIQATITTEHSQPRFIIMKLNKK